MGRQRPAAMRRRSTRCWCPVGGLLRRGSRRGTAGRSPDETGGCRAGCRRRAARRGWTWPGQRPSGGTGDQLQCLEQAGPEGYEGDRRDVTGEVLVARVHPAGAGAADRMRGDEDEVVGAGTGADQPSPAARWASQRDRMRSAPTSSRCAIGARRAAVVSLKTCSCPVMAMPGIWKAARARGLRRAHHRPAGQGVGRSSRAGSMMRIAAVTAGIRNSAQSAALVIAPPLITSTAPSRIGPSAR